MVTPWCSSYHHCTTSFSWVWTQVLRRFNPARGVSEIHDGEDLWQWSRLNNSSSRFWIRYFMIDVRQYYAYALDSEYTGVLNMLELQVVLNKIPHNRYLSGFWICHEFWICQCYIGFCSYSSGSQYARPWIYKGCEYVKVIQSSV